MKYAVGIDLGTTNCALAYVDLKRSRRDRFPKVEVFSIPQLVELGEVAPKPLLPSFLYLPGENELPAGSLNLPWNANPTDLVGEAAQKQGVRVPGRLVASAKSWLCHGGVDRKADILPWHTDEATRRVSPVAASMRYLLHLRDAWNHAIAKDDPESRLENQRVVVTAPASFDEVARELTVEAANQAGLKDFILLEEPQAAFYRWLNDPAGQNAQGLPVGSTCLVIDCGGGTTDFSLIGVVEREGKAEYERVAVGEHLLLGGDNMDIAIARHVEQAVSPGRRLDSTQWGNLVLNCRRLKERMLGPDAPASLTVTVLGRGSRVIGSTLSCELDRSTVQRLTLEGFLPNVGYGEEPARASRAGLQEFGLPYVADPAITRHLAYFLNRHSASIREISLDQSSRPTAILFNGGVFNAESCRRQILHVMRSWFGADWEPTILDSSSMDLAVAQGAACYAWARQTGARRIVSSAARSYYVGVGANQGDGSSGPGATTNEQGAGERQTVVCVVPHGLQEGETLTIEDVPLELQLGEPVAFPLYTSTVRTRDRAGELFTIEPGQLEELPALTTILRGGRRAGNKAVAVKLETKLTEMGTLELHCAAKEGQNRWKLQFQARPRPASADGAASPGPAASRTIGDTWSQEQLQGAISLLQQVYGPDGSRVEPSVISSLPKLLEESLGLSRGKWPTAVLRALAETLQELAAGRTKSPEREWRWHNLIGYCLRPGWGDALDPFRVEQLWKTIHAGVSGASQKSDQAWTEYWIMLRRVAGGLDVNRQKELSKRMLAYLPSSGPGNKKPPRRAGPQELAEIWRAIASLELIDVSTKVGLGETLLKQLKKKPAPRHAPWALTRLGSRVPLYGPINVVVDKKTAENWLRGLLQIDAEGLRSEVDFAITQIARYSGDRARDVDEDLRKSVLAHLESHQVPEHWQQMVAELTSLDESDENQLLGDAIPPGLRLIARE